MSAMTILAIVIAGFLVLGIGLGLGMLVLCACLADPSYRETQR